MVRFTSRTTQSSSPRVLETKSHRSTAPGVLSRLSCYAGGNDHRQLVPPPSVEGISRSHTARACATASPLGVSTRAGPPLETTPTFPGLGSVPCAAQSDVSQTSDTSRPHPHPPHHSVRTSLAARLPPQEPHSPLTDRASAKCVSKQLLSQPHAPRPGLAGDADARTGRRRYRAARSSRGRARGTHWALLRCRRSCRADRGRRRRRRHLR